MRYKFGIFVCLQVGLKYRTPPFTYSEQSFDKVNITKKGTKKSIFLQDKYA